MTDIEKSIFDIDEKIRMLEEEISVLKSKKIELLKTDRDIIAILPPRIRNAMRRMYIKTNSEFIRFLEGNVPQESLLYGGFQYTSYKKANTRRERLLCIRGVGETTVQEVLELLAQNNL